MATLMAPIVATPRDPPTARWYLRGKHQTNVGDHIAFSKHFEVLTILLHVSLLFQESV
jgi:hypothetical protein